MSRKLYFVSVFAILGCISYSQVLPELPDLPSVAPTVVPSISAAPIPSESSDPTPSPTPSNIPPGSAAPSISTSSIPSPSASSEELLPLPDVSPGVDEFQCIRNVDLPAPTLGTSQLRYALSVVASAAAVALASMIYTASAGWDGENFQHDGLRVTAILIARLLIIFAIKISAALVASISNSSPEDGALDASGAFLTWASAILTRTYYEAIQMTLKAIGFFEEQSFWDQELRIYLNPYHNRKKKNLDQESVQQSSVDLNSVNAIHNGLPSRTDLSMVELGDGREEAKDLIDLENYSNSTAPKKASLLALFTGGRRDRQLLLFHSFIYMLSEITMLIINLKNFVDSFSDDAARTLFVSEEEAGQCGITGSDAPLLFGLVTTQVIYLITQQQSLIPILTIAASSPRTKITASIRIGLIGVFVAWILSLFCLPLFQEQMNVLFLVGDISLFWQVLIGPPSYSNTGFIIAATYAVLSAGIGTYIFVKIMRYNKTLPTLPTLPEDVLPPFFRRNEESNSI